jgi:hypothetical protein
VGYPYEKEMGYPLGYPYYTKIGIKTHLYKKVISRKVRKQGDSNK